MSPHTDTQPPLVVRQFQLALRSNRPDCASQLIDRLHADAPQLAKPLVAQFYLSQRNWTAAAQAFAQIADQNPQFEFNRRLANNMAAFVKHRPNLADILQNPPAHNQYQIAPACDGRPTILRQTDDGPQMLGSNIPLPQVHQHWHKALDKHLDNDHSLAICGLLDGYIVNMLNQDPPQLHMDQQLTTYLVQPDLDMLLISMMIHDWAQPDGPIAHPRFRWLIGPHWPDQLEHELKSDPYQPAPTGFFNFDPHIPDIQAKMQTRIANRHANVQQARQRIHAADPVRAAQAIDILTSNNPPRPPRVLLLTSRFTTVLQYAARDVATAFEKRTWQTHTIKEPKTHHRTTGAAITAAVESFDPDLIFQFDHLRSECATLPPHRPAICWAMDLLDNLTHPDAGPSVNHTEFIASFFVDLLAQRHNYPRRQMLDLPMMLTAAKPQKPDPHAPNILYTSNVADTPPQAIEKLLDDFPSAGRDFIRSLAAALIQRYEQNKPIDSLAAMRNMVDHAAKKNADLHVAQQGRIMATDRLWTRLNILLYRQQALRWAIAAANDLDLSIGIYGQGWDKNPEFAPYARGPVAPGPDLWSLIAGAKINLCLEPYTAFTHQRMIDAVAAGGFSLIRHHGSNHTLPQLCAFLAQHAPHAPDVPTARDILAHQHAKQFDTLCQDAARYAFDQAIDPVAQLRAWQRTGVLDPNAPAQNIAMPHLHDITFRDPASCKSLIQHFTTAPDAPDLRQKIATAQTACVQNRTSFDAGIQKLVNFIQNRLSKDKPSSL